MAEPPSLQKECFFIAPIGDEGTEIRRRSDGVLAAIVEPAAAELGLSAVRADRLARPGQITLEVIDHLLGARAAVADLTGRNPNVFYELAVRHTARLPVVLIAEEGEVLPFDTAQMRTIFFLNTDLGSAMRCKRDLVEQLRQALAGNFDSPIATTVDVLALRSGDTVQRTLADLLGLVGQMSGEVQAARREIQLLSTARHGPSEATRLPVRTETSVGCIVFRRIEGGTQLVVAQASRVHDRATWTLPKGDPRPGESFEETARRAVSEETGLEGRVIEELDAVRYTFIQRATRIHKTVRYYLVEHTGGDLDARGGSFAEVRWLPLDDAATSLSFETERTVVALASTRLRDLATDPS
jgi:ADP-ribose pyrophosphatase YjhB (NUDIX family)